MYPFIVFFTLESLDEMKMAEPKDYFQSSNHYS